MQTNLNYELSYGDTIADQNLSEHIIRYRNSYKGSLCFSDSLYLVVTSNFHDIVKTVLDIFEAQSLSDAHLMCFDSHTAAIWNDKVFFSVNDRNESNSGLNKVYDRTIHFDGFGDHYLLTTIIDDLRAKITESRVPTLTWEYLGDGNRDTQDTKIARPKPIFDEFYPWLGGDVYAYFDEFLASESSILVLLGETGTAKTSFIRSMIWHACLNTVFTHEEELLKSDSLFVDFITDERKHLLVVEDADLFLTSREHDGNKIMSKFLNIGDGLAAIGKKKIIFTANLTEPSKIDNALLRAGRCFDCQIFRRLTYDEAVAAAKVAGIPVPPGGRTYSLAELFETANPKKNRPKFSQTKLGFTR